MYKLSWIKEDIKCGWQLEMMESRNPRKAFKSALKELRRGYYEYKYDKFIK